MKLSKKIMLSVDEKLYAQLKEISDIQSQSIGASIRQILNLYVETRLQTYKALAEPETFIQIAKTFKDMGMIKTDDDE